MRPEIVVAILAIIKIGGIFLLLFSGFGAGAVAGRSQHLPCTPAPTVSSSHPERLNAEFRPDEDTPLGPTAIHALRQRAGKLQTVAAGPELLHGEGLVGAPVGSPGAGVLEAQREVTRPAANPQQDHMSPQDRFKRDQDRFATYLGLDQSQREQVNKITADYRNQLDQLRQKIGPQFKALDAETFAKVRAVLNEKQQQKYDDFQKTHPRGDRGRPPHPSDKDGRDGKDKDKDKDKH